MNLLTTKLPSKVRIGKYNYEINTDFRISIQFENLINDKYLQQEEIINRAIKLYYPITNMNITNDSKQELIIYYNNFVENFNQAIDRMLWFHRCGKEKTTGKEESKISVNEIYSYEYDSDLIYSAFLDQYRLDLQEQDKLHWWKFKALFNALREDNEIYKRMSVRAMDLNKLKGEEREHYKKLKKIYELPLQKEEQEINDRLNEILANGGSLNDLK